MVLFTVQVILFINLISMYNNIMIDNIYLFILLLHGTRLCWCSLPVTFIV